MNAQTKVLIYKSSAGGTFQMFRPRYQYSSSPWEVPCRQSAQEIYLKALIERLLVDQIKREKSKASSYSHRDQTKCKVQIIKETYFLFYIKILPARGTVNIVCFIVKGHGLELDRVLQGLNTTVHLLHLMFLQVLFPKENKRTKQENICDAIRVCDAPISRIR